MMVARSNAKDSNNIDVSLNESKAQGNNDQKNVSLEKKLEKFGTYLWQTIIVLLLAYIGAYIIAIYKTNEQAKPADKAKIEQVIIELKNRFPELAKINRALTEQSIKQVKIAINENIDEAYEPLYGQIDNLSDFHYSLTGEYSELLSAITGNVEAILKEKLLGPANFEERLHRSLVNIDRQSALIIKKQFEKIKQGVEKETGLDNDESKFLIGRVFELLKEDAVERFFGYKGLFFKSMGLAASTKGAALIGTKFLVKNVSQLVAKKIWVKLAIKGAPRVASTVAGASIGGAVGLMCGPGAVICSSIGAVVGGIIVWFATDKAIVESDQFFNEDDFKQEIRKAIDTEKEKTKAVLYKIYFESFKNIGKDTEEAFREFKEKPVKDIMLKVH